MKHNLTIAGLFTIILFWAWNQSRILQQNGKVTFWLNDVQTVALDPEGNILEISA
jgi:hypothetical protein